MKCDFLKNIEAVINNIVIPIISTLEVVSKNPIINAGAFPHSLFDELFPQGADVTTLEKNWNKIRIFLWNNRVSSLMKNNREERYKQILDAQDVKAYIAVCRSIYPEIECLLREEFLLNDLSFCQKYEQEKNKKQFIQRSLKELINDLCKPLGINKEEVSLEEIGWFNAALINQLEISFESFEPNVFKNKKNLGMNRHFYIHGWSQKADFIHALNALLLFDQTMKIIQQYKK